MYHEEDFERIDREYISDLLKGRKVAEENGMTLSKFKSEINKGLTTTNDEDQWTYDYESYLCSISDGIYVDPIYWGEEFYFGRWDLIVGK